MERYYPYRDPRWGYVVYVPYERTVIYENAPPPPPTWWSPQTDELYLYTSHILLPGLAARAEKYPSFEYKVSREKEFLRIDTNIPVWTGDEKNTDFMKIYVDARSGQIIPVAYGDYTENGRPEVAAGPNNVLFMVDEYIGRVGPPVSLNLQKKSGVLKPSFSPS